MKSILVDDKGAVEGVLMADGSRIRSKIVLSNATAHVTFLNLLQPETLPKSYLDKIKAIDYTSPVTKINGLYTNKPYTYWRKLYEIPAFCIVALKELPNFTADPHSGSGPAPHHRCTVHLNCEDSRMLDEAYQQGSQGLIPDRYV